MQNNELVEQNNNFISRAFRKIKSIFFKSASIPEIKKEISNSNDLQKSGDEITKIAEQVMTPEEISTIDMQREIDLNNSKEINKMEINSIILNGNNIELTSLTASYLLKYCNENNIEINSPSIDLDNLPKELKIKLLDIIADRETDAAAIIFNDDTLEIIPDGRKRNNDFFYNVNTNYNLIKFKEKQGTITDEYKMMNLEKIVTDTGKYLKETGQLLDKAIDELEK